MLFCGWAFRLECCGLEQRSRVLTRRAGCESDSPLTRGVPGSRDITERSETVSSGLDGKASTGGSELLCP